MSRKYGNGGQRNNYLFGANLGEKIKANKTAEKSGLQIKRSDASATSSRKHPKVGMVPTSLFTDDLLAS